MIRSNHLSHLCTVQLFRFARIWTYGVWRCRRSGLRSRRIRRHFAGRNQSVAAGGDYAINHRLLTDFRLGFFRLQIARSPERAQKILCFSVDKNLHGCPSSAQNCDNDWAVCAKNRLPDINLSVGKCVCYSTSIDPAVSCGSEKEGRSHGALIKRSL
jgi:hypothetical protein